MYIWAQCSIPRGDFFHYHQRLLLLLLLRQMHLHSHLAWIFQKALRASKTNICQKKKTSIPGAITVKIYRGFYIWKFEDVIHTFENDLKVCLWKTFANMTEFGNWNLFPTFFQPFFEPLSYAENRGNFEIFKKPRRSMCFYIFFLLVFCDWRTEFGFFASKYSIFC